MGSAEQIGKQKSGASPTPPKRVRKTVETKIQEMRNQMRKLDEQFDDMRENPKRRPKQPQKNQKKDDITPSVSIELPEKKELNSINSPAKEPASSSVLELPSSPPLVKISKKRVSTSVQSPQPKKDASPAKKETLPARKDALPAKKETSLAKKAASPAKKEASPVKTLLPSASFVRERVNQIKFDLSIMKKENCDIPEVKRKHGEVKAKLDKLKCRLKEVEEKCALRSLQWRQKMMYLSECREKELGKQCERLTKNVNYIKRTKSKMAMLETSMTKVLANRGPSGPYITFAEIVRHWLRYFLSWELPTNAPEKEATWHDLVKREKSSEIKTESVKTPLPSSNMAKANSLIAPLSQLKKKGNKTSAISMRSPPKAPKEKPKAPKTSMSVRVRPADKKADIKHKKAKHAHNVSTGKHGDKGLKSPKPPGEKKDRKASYSQRALPHKKKLTLAQPSTQKTVHK
ncbi:hypothetical protein QR680_006168 [Steinernema hermaphroditum]|uniref:Uncharacterized protein n=1 Tax=Steinernema hermaphroditum TaxID=289476 RepID=A0AA39HWR7_9BILA|nr:hypothetical protein QR680_006168 [Steinernema hermaphroditum]